MSNNWKHLYDNFLPLMEGKMKQYANEIGPQFGAAYWDNIHKKEEGAYRMTMRCNERLNQINPTNPTAANAADACEWVLRDAFEAWKRNTSTAQNNPFSASNPFSSQTSAPPPTEFVDPDLVTTTSSAFSATTAAPASANTVATTTPTHSSGKSPFSGVTSKMLEDRVVEPIELEQFDRRHVVESAVNTVTTAARIRYGDTPAITLLKAKARVPLSDPNAFEPILRKTFSSDLVGMYWAISVEFKRLYTLPVPLAEYNRLVEEISARTSTEGYTAELIINVLKSCSQATYETMSNYLVSEFNKQSTRFIRSEASLKESITLRNLDGIIAFMNNPPKSKLTENPNSITRFAQLVNGFFRSMFSSSNSPQNATTLTKDNYTTYMHNDAVGVWDSVFGISKYGIPFLSHDDQRDWLARVNDRMTFLSRDETVFITNTMPPEFISNTSVGNVVHAGNDGDVRTLLSLLRVCDYKETDHVAGVIATPVSRHGTHILGNYAIINPLEKPAMVQISRRASL